MNIPLATRSHLKNINSNQAIRAVAKGHRRRALPEFASQLDQPLRAQRGGRTIALHPFEAGLLSLVKGSSEGKTASHQRSTQDFRKGWIAGRARRPANQWLLVIPKGFTLAVLRVLLSKLGYPPWDAETLAAAKAEHASDRAQIDKLYQQFLKGRGKCLTTQSFLAAASRPLPSIGFSRESRATRKVVRAARSAFRKRLGKSD